MILCPRTTSWSLICYLHAYDNLLSHSHSLPFLHTGSYSTTSRSTYVRLLVQHYFLGQDLDQEANRPMLFTKYTTPDLMPGLYPSWLFKGRLCYITWKRRPSHALCDHHDTNIDWFKLRRSTSTFSFLSVHARGYIVRYPLWTSSMCTVRECMREIPLRSTIAPRWARDPTISDCWWSICDTIQQSANAC